MFQKVNWTIVLQTVIGAILVATIMHVTTSVGSYMNTIEDTQESLKSTQKILKMCGFCGYEKVNPLDTLPAITTVANSKNECISHGKHLFCDEGTYYFDDYGLLQKAEVAYMGNECETNLNVALKTMHVAVELIDETRYNDARNILKDGLKFIEE